VGLQYSPNFSRDVFHYFFSVFRIFTPYRFTKLILSATKCAPTLNKAIVDIRLRPRSTVLPLVGQFEYSPRCHIHASPYWVTLNIRFLSRRLFLVVMCKHDVIHKTGSTWRITAPPEEDRATAMHKIVQIGFVHNCRDMVGRGHRQTDTLITKFTTALSLYIGRVIINLNSLHHPQRKSESSFEWNGEKQWHYASLIDKKYFKR